MADPTYESTFSPSLRDYLKANMFDGDDGGTVTMSISSLLDDICNEVTHFQIEVSGVAGLIEGYYLDHPSTSEVS